MRRVRFAISYAAVVANERMTCPALQPGAHGATLSEALTPPVSRSRGRCLIAVLIPTQRRRFPTRQFAVCNRTDNTRTNCLNKVARISADEAD
jgi:hypothetical protein